VLLDVERPREGLSELLPLADYVVSAADFPSKLIAHEATTTAAAAAAAPPSVDEERPETLAAFVLQPLEPYP